MALNGTNIDLCKECHFPYISKHLKEMQEIDLPCSICDASPLIGEPVNDFVQYYKNLNESLTISCDFNEPLESYLKSNAPAKKAPSTDLLQNDSVSSLNDVENNTRVSFAL
jgi:hypothetical protein